MHRGIGSTQFSATCRAMVAVQRHPDDPDTRVVTISKSSLASKSNLRTLSYMLEPVFNGTVDTSKRDRTRMVWGPWIDLTEYDIAESVKDAPKKAMEHREAKKKAAEVIDALLAEFPKGIPDADLKQRLEREAIPVSRLSTLMSGLNLRLRVLGGGKGLWLRKITV